VRLALPLDGEIFLEHAQYDSLHGQLGSLEGKVLGVFFDILGYYIHL
jgi:hypothetical protein